MLLRPRLLQPPSPSTISHLTPYRHINSACASPSRPFPLHSHPPNRYHHPRKTSARRAFTTSIQRPQRPTTQSHYDVLGVDPSADAPTLKKRFYTLSREHHPDLHPTDKSAVQRFQQISESYSVLSDPQKRTRYDRDVLRLHDQRQPQSSYQSSRGGTYAGSRAPTGLSRRRSAFRGPPPSYFAQGQGGSYDPYANARGPEEAAAAGGGSSGEPQYGPSGAAADGAAEFDSRGVYRTQTHEDRKRNARRAAAMAAAQAAAEEDGDFWARFVIVSCVLLTGVTIGSLLVSDDSGKRAGGMVKSDGSRRKVD